jgi:hypothetical protein
MEHHNTYRPNMHAIEYYLDSSDDDSNERYLAKFAWPPTS